MLRALCFALVSVAAILPTTVTAELVPVDKRIRSENLDYRIAFCARPSDGRPLPTHAFVVYSRAQPDGTVDFMRATGWAPAAGSKYTSSAVIGAFSDEIYTDAAQVCLPVLVNSEVWQNALDLANAVNYEEVFYGDIAQLSERFSVYRLLESDCITFVQSIAESIGLVVPDRGALRPVDYVPRLAEANQ